MTDGDPGKEAFGGNRRCCRAACVLTTQTREDGLSRGGIRPCLRRARKDDSGFQLVAEEHGSGPVHADVTDPFATGLQMEATAVELALLVARPFVNEATSLRIVSLSSVVGRRAAPW